jgi:hypothetical protein
MNTALRAKVSEGAPRWVRPILTSSLTFSVGPRRLWVLSGGAGGRGMYWGHAKDFITILACVCTECSVVSRCVCKQAAWWRRQNTGWRQADNVPSTEGGHQQCRRCRLGEHALGRKWSMSYSEALTWEGTATSLDFAVLEPLLRNQAHNLGGDGDDGAGYESISQV